MTLFDILTTVVAAAATTGSIFLIRGVVDIIHEQREQMPLRRWKEMRLHLAAQVALIYLVVLVGSVDWGLHRGFVVINQQRVLNFPPLAHGIIIGSLIVLPLMAVIAYTLPQRFAPQGH